MDLSTPEGRLAAAERLGPEGYNRAMDEFRRNSTVATVNGRGIRVVQSSFGQLYAIDGTTKAYRDRADAEAYAASLPGQVAP